MKDRQTYKELEQTVHNLNRQVKFLNCLRDISAIFEKEFVPEEEILQDVIDMIPSAFISTETTSARLVLANREIRSKHFPPTKSSYIRNIDTGNEHICTLEICSQEQDIDELIDTVAEQIERFIERRQTETAISSYSNELERLMLQTNDELKREIDERKRAERILKESEGRLRSFIEIGLALSGERNINRLLTMVVDVARNLSCADAGTIYLIDEKKMQLEFKILQNDTLDIRMEGDTDIPFLGIQLYIDGKPNYSNVSSYVALTGNSVNIPDIYGKNIANFEGPKHYDTVLGYRSRSMLVIPMKDHENNIIGVLQLINARTPLSDEIIPFSPTHADLIASLASQAAVALTNDRLIREQKELFYAFIKSIATAIDEKSPYTNNHINRVVNLTMRISELINKDENGPFKGFSFSSDELEELRLAAWMHDVGKITTPKHVIDKATRLQVISDKIDLIEMRFRMIAASIENTYLKKLLQGKYRINGSLAKSIAEIEDDFNFLKNRNESYKRIEDNEIVRIKKIAGKVFSLNGNQYPYLMPDEVENLCIPEGTLNKTERKIIEKHTEMTMKILKELSFPTKLSKVPNFAAEHHEKLDGSGYHQGLSKENLSLQSRIIALADIFEAFTAKDRPYRKPMKLSEAVKTMRYMKDGGQIDPDVFDLFIGSREYLDYAKKELFPEQIDVMK